MHLHIHFSYHLKHPRNRLKQRDKRKTKTEREKEKAECEAVKRRACRPDKQRYPYIHSLALSSHIYTSVPSAVLLYCSTLYTVHCTPAL
mmetsp:Transcript_35479/g.92429  ORF Transcript_35479/g.92429 Transcript_35479/m.92429 type:complete len:89 (-) Transcript_35479:2033-2299(-)